LIGVLSVSAASITATTSATGSVAVLVGDLVYAVLAEQTSLTVTACADNLGNTYTAANAGTLSGTAVSGRAFYARVTVAGTLTSVNFTCTASAHDVVAIAAAIGGPVSTPLLDANPANTTADITSPFIGPATGTLATAQEIVMAFGAANYGTAWTATAPNLLAGDLASATNVKLAVGYQKVNSTASVTPTFASAGNPANSVVGTTSFRVGALTAIASATGTGAANAVSTAFKRSPGLAAGTGLAAATGRAVIREPALAAGTSTAAATGRAYFRRTATAAGTSTAVALSRAGSNAAAAGTSTALATGRAYMRRAVTAAGVGASAFQSKAGSRGQAAGTGTATATGRAINRRTVTAAGTGAALALSKPGSNANAAGTGAAIAVGRAIWRRQAVAAGIGTATATGLRFARRTATAAGLGTSTVFANGAQRRTATAAGTGAANAVSHVTARAVAHAAGTSDAFSIWRFAPYTAGVCAAADHLVERLEAAIAKYGQTITLQRTRTDSATGEIIVSESIVCAAVVRNYIPQDLEAGEVQDIRIIISPRWLVSFGLPNRDDRIVVNDNPSNIEQIAPLYFCGQAVRVNLLARG
jgi:hypothetical protein